ncbi:GNAT family N-acetyltransferase, partial [Ferrimicrobium acidiphilum]
LVVAMLDWARQHELRQVRLRVRLMNLVAQRLYQRHGFIDAGKPPDEVHGVCEIEMVHLL